MPIILAKPRRLSERVKRHVALRDLATTQAADKGQMGNRDAASP